jgi:hypothetical protein
MACTILRPDPQALFDQIQSAFSSTVLGGGKVIPESNEWYVVSNDYAAAEQFYAIADQMWRENNPETACCENLYAMAAQHGVFPAPAAHAEGYAKLTGTPGSPIPPAFEIQTSNGTYVSVGSVPLTMPSEGTITIRIRALVPGAEANANGNITSGTLVTPAPGIDPEVIICGGSFCGGTEAEDCEAFRKRYLERLAYQPRATQAWIKQKLMEWPCATRVCIREGSCCRCNAECSECGCKNCGNRMEFYVLFDDAFPCGIPPQHVVDDITNWIFGDPQGYGLGQVEIGVCGKIYTPIPLMVNVIIDIEGCPSTGQKQLITDQIEALFKRICPSMKLCAKQLELIIASIIGADINAAVRFEIVGYENAVPPYPRSLAYVDHCCIEPECDVLCCLDTISFVNPEMTKPPC